MNAETGTEPDAPKKRGRIPQSAWPQILERYRSGATLSAIAREFECTPSAISYIIRKAEAAGGPGEDDAGAAPGEAEAADAEAPAQEPAVTAKPARAERRAPEPKAEAPKAEAAKSEAQAPEPKVAESPAEERRPTLTMAQPTAQPAPAPAPAPTETLRLNRPEPQPAAQPAPVTPAPQPAAAAQPAGTPAAGRTEPTPPVDAVEARLRETARGCLAAYRGWRQQPGEASIQSLSDAVHELRKALARIEIDMSASRREEQAIRPIPIPAHRAARRTP